VSPSLCCNVSEMAELELRGAKKMWKKKTVPEFEYIIFFVYIEPGGNLQPSDVIAPRRPILRIALIGRLLLVRIASVAKPICTLPALFTNYWLITFV
jgi:hypothetical protein